MTVTPTATKAKASFTPELFAFLADLRENNNREWFAANKDRYESAVLEPAGERLGGVGEPAQPRPVGRDGTAEAVVHDLRQDRIPGAPDCDRRPRCLCVLGDVRQRLGDGGVDRGFQRGLKPFTGDAQLDRHPRAHGQALERRREPVPAQRVGMYPAAQVAERGQSVLQLVESLRHQSLGRGAGRVSRRATQREGGQNEPLLRAVVQIELQPLPSLYLSGVHNGLPSVA